MRPAMLAAPLTALTCLLCGCQTTGSPVSSAPAVPPAAATQTAAAKAAPTLPREATLLTRDTPLQTTAGNTFVAPTGWRVTTRGQVTLLTPPEGGSAIALVDVQAKSAEAALAAAWQAYKPQASWPLKVVHQQPDKDGWTDRASYSYQTSPNERRDVSAQLQRVGGVWTVAISDMAKATGGKRLAQVALIFGQLLPKGYTRESFAGKQAHPLDQARLAQLSAFIKRGMKATGVPGVALGLLQDGKLVLARGFGVRALGGKQQVDADTLFMIASNTKALTTLMLAKLVDEQKLTWETPVTSLLPTFKLGDPDTTRQVLVKHLICACTGLPRQDYEWLFQFKDLTPARALAALATMQPTSKFGELFQYSNPLAGAGGFVGGHVAFPRLELGAAYDRTMQTRVFGPLGMKATTFDYAAARRGNHALPHAQDVDGRPAPALMALNYAIRPVRPAGAAWSNVRDLLAYVAMELAEGALPGGQRYVYREALLARRTPQVPLGKDATYGMGLMVDRKHDVEVVHHGGDLMGYHSDMMWLPAHGVGAVILTNGEPGWILRNQLRRKLLEVLFDGRPEADAQLAADAKTYFSHQAAERKLLTVPAAAGTGKLARRYRNGALGEISVSRQGKATVFDFGEWQSEMATRKNPDGTVSFVTIAPGLIGLEFVVSDRASGKRALIIRDAQHEYVFDEI